MARFAWLSIALTLLTPFAHAQPTWSLLAPANAPDARHAHGMVHDVSRGEVILFGGGSSACCTEYADTWAWDGTDWTRLTPATSPSARGGEAFTYDTARQVGVLFGGWNGSSRLNDTWEWDGSTWTQALPPQSPPARDSHLLAFDARRSRTVLFGGGDANRQLLGDTWEYDGHTWVEHQPLHAPSPRWSYGIAHHRGSGQTILFGGYDGTSSVADTWAWDGQDWTQLHPLTSPSARANHRMAYDPLRDTIVLHGGSAANIFDDTWEWDGHTWNPIPTALAPIPINSMGLAFDPRLGQMVLFGGRATSFSLRETWTLQRPARTPNWHQNPINGHWYALTTPVSWTEADTQAAWFGGHLATIRNAGEQAWIESTFAATDLWIGFTDEAVEGQWQWTSGEPVTYTNWDSGQPDNHQGNQDHARLLAGSGHWDDHFEWIATPGLIEVTHILRDDFDDNAIDPLKWNVVTAGIPGRPAVHERNQHIELVGRGHLVTVSEFDPIQHGGIRITGFWTFAQIGGDFDFMQILTRSDGIPSGRYGETQNGLQFTIHTGLDVFGIGERGTQITLGPQIREGSFAFEAGQTYEFEIVDTPSSASFRLWTPGRRQTATATVPILSDTTTVKHIVFHNREGSSNIAHLDDVSITVGAQVVPFGAGCSGTLGLPRLTASRPPRLGEAFALNIQNVQPHAFTILLLDLARVLPALDLTHLGMPGCHLHVAGGLVFWQHADANGQLTWPDPLGPPLILPNDTALIGGSVFFQAIVEDPPQGAPPTFVVTNALHAVVGP